MSTAVFPLGDARVDRVTRGRFAGSYTYQCRGCGATWDAPPGRRSSDPPWWVCPKQPPCNWDVLEEFRCWSAVESQREIAEHAARVREQQRHIDGEITQILGADPDAEQFAGRMADERPRTAEENFALIRGTDSRPTLIEQAEKRTEQVKDGTRRGKQRRGECAWCHQKFWYYPSRQPGRFDSAECRSRYNNLARSRSS